MNKDKQTQQKANEEWKGKKPNKPKVKNGEHPNTKDWQKKRLKIQLIFEMRALLCYYVAWNKDYLVLIYWGDRVGITGLVSNRYAHVYVYHAYPSGLPLSQYLSVSGKS